jgi:anti-anti-sigma factor
METTQFAAEPRQEDGVAVLELSGDVSAAAEGSLQEAYGAVGAEPVVVLDFTAVDYINSTGIALIVGILAEARKAGQEVRARGLAPHYREIFRITRLSDFMTILDEEGEQA